MLFLVFPKVFEYRKFMVEVNTKIVAKIRVNKTRINFDVVCVNFGGNGVQPNDAKDDKWKTNYHAFACKLINESDIQFLLRLTEFMAEFKTEYAEVFHHFEFLVFGTCGTTEIEGHKYGAAFNITTAYKGDRGELTWASETNPHVFKIRSQKVTKADMEYKASICAADCAEICSANFLMKSKVPLLKKSSDLPTGGVSLYDMETYDFFKICEYHRARHGGAIRVVSDKCTEEPIHRRLCSLKNGVRLLRKRLESDSHFYCPQLANNLSLPQLTMYCQDERIPAITMYLKTAKGSLLNAKQIATVSMLNMQVAYYNALVKTITYDFEIRPKRVEVKLSEGETPKKAAENPSEGELLVVNRSECDGGSFDYVFFYLFRKRPKMNLNEIRGDIKFYCDTAPTRKEELEIEQIENVTPTSANGQNQQELEIEQITIDTTTSANGQNQILGLSPRLADKQKFTADQENKKHSDNC